MNFILRAAFVLILGLLASCANQGQSYASQHPELSAAQRQILSTGTIPNGDAVAGMTRGQIRIAMKGDPTTFDRIEGEDVWIYVRQKAVAKNPDREPPGPSFGGSSSARSFTERVSMHRSRPWYSSAAIGRPTRRPPRNGQISRAALARYPGRAAETADNPTL